MFSQRHNILILTTFLAFLVAACTSSPTGRSQMILKSDAELEAQSSREFAKLRAEAPLVTDQATVQFVHCVAVAIVESLQGPEKDMNWELAVIDTEEQNAFVMPGGKIAVFEGILDVASNQNELATVMGHEVAHVTARHANERASRGEITDIGVYIAAIVLGQGHGGMTHTAQQGLSAGAQLGVFLPHTRSQESEADVLGLEYMARAGFDPRESVELWKKMQKEHEDDAPPEFLSTHPSSETRIESLVSQYTKVLPLFNEAREAGRNPNCTR
jgi:predicted Zn-dependent protease